MVFCVNRSGTDIGATLGYAEYVPTHVTLPWAEDVFMVLEYVFGVASWLMSWDVEGLWYFVGIAMS